VQIYGRRGGEVFSLGGGFYKTIGRRNPLLKNKNCALTRKNNPPPEERTLFSSKK
jgi:hypothetical protein